MLSWSRSWVLLVILLSSSVSGAEKVRVYPFGEDDLDGEIGEIVLETSDIQTPPTEDTEGAPVNDAAGEFVPLLSESEPIYVEGRDGKESLAIDFDGIDDRLSSQSFDPRNFSTFAALSQAWVKPDSAKRGARQAVWSLGRDNGGVGITEDGRWELIAVSIIPDMPSEIEVAFDEWSTLR